MDGAAFCAAPDAGSDQRRSGTQDVNDPVYGPTTRPDGPVGVVHVLGSACRSHRADEWQSRRVFPAVARLEMWSKPCAFWASKCGT